MVSIVHFLVLWEGKVWKSVVFNNLFHFALGITEWVWVQERISRQWDWLRPNNIMLRTNWEMSYTGELLDFLIGTLKQLLEKERKKFGFF